MLAAGAVQAQETNTVGNPQLKDFELPGTRTTPPATQQQQPPATTAPPPATIPPASTTPNPATAPTIANSPAQGPAAPSPTTTQPSAGQAPARRPREAPRAAAPTPTSTEVPAGVPAPAELEQSLPAPIPAPLPVAPEAGQPAAVPAGQAEPEAPFPWLYAGLGLVLALLSIGGFLAFRRSKSASAARNEEAAAPAATAPEAPAEPDPLFARRTAAKPAPAAAAPGRAQAPGAAPAPAPAPAPATSPAPVSDGIVSLAMRPRLELEFRADRAAATLTETSVQFELTIRNSGNRTARNIRVQVHMMNAGPEQEREIGAFFAAPVDTAEPPVFAALAPKAEVHMRSGVTLPNDRLREITIQGRRLFIPVVAFNVYYEWEDGRTGQTSMSYLVGREAPTPQEKMGAFRLDLGPRLYRSVGQRQGNLAKVV